MFADVARGKIPLCVAVVKADHIAALIEMKRAVDKATGSKIRLVLEGAHEAHLVRFTFLCPPSLISQTLTRNPTSQLADELAQEEVGVVINPPRSYPGSWDGQRTLAGPPLTEHTLASLLTAKGVVVGLGHATSDATRNARYDALWNYHAVPGTITPEKALGLVSANLLKLLGVKAENAPGRFIAVEGDAFGMGSRVVGVVDDGLIELF